MKSIIKIAVLALAILLIMFMMLIAIVGSQHRDCGGTAYNPIDTSVGSTEQFNAPDQIENIKKIIGIGLARKFSLRDIKIALIVAMQESNIRNLSYGDRDSLGIYQQRPSQGWGTPQQILDPVYAINKFYDALDGIKNRENKSLFEVAIAVQRPDRAAYARTWNSHVAPADALLAGVVPASGSTGTIAMPADGCTNGTSNVEVAVQAALSQVDNKQYDAVELAQWAYAQAGVTLPGTLEAQLKAGSPVAKPGSGTESEWLTVLQRGDLLFWADEAGNLLSVTIYLGDNKGITVWPDRVKRVEAVPWRWVGRHLIGATRPIDNNSNGGEHSGWQWPVKERIVTSPFGMRFNPVTKQWALHAGVDFGVPIGTPVYAAKAGTVTFTGYFADSGNMVIIDHGGGVETMYMHLSSFKAKVGDKVSGGQLVALSGNTGGSTGPHLHFVVAVNGQRIDPVVYLRQFGLTP